MKKKFFYLLFLGVVLLFPIDMVRAASLSFFVVPPTVRQGDIFVIELRLSSPGERINVLDGAILFNKDRMKVEDVSTGDSIFNLWTRTPVFSNQTGKIVFTGGVAGGFKGQDGSALKIIFSAKKTGAASVSFSSDTFLFLNDGRGTKISPQFQSAEIVIAQSEIGSSARNEWRERVATDKNAPTNLQVALGKDDPVFGGKYFINFSAQDAGTGINYYAIKEGVADFVRSESPYVLKDQSLRSKIFVKAVDKAGNEEVRELDPSAEPFNYRLMLVIIVVLVLLWVGIRFVSKKYVGENYFVGKK